jgi:hypothetical protein
MATEHAAGPVLEPSKKIRKRKKNKASSEVPSPIQAWDGPLPPKDIAWRTHVAGMPMLNHSMLSIAPSNMLSLHDAILYEETHRIKEKDEAYMVLAVKVPKGLGFVEASYADKFYLRYSDIFDMY